MDEVQNHFDYLFFHKFPEIADKVRRQVVLGHATGGMGVGAPVTQDDVLFACTNCPEQVHGGVGIGGMTGGVVINGFAEVVTEK